jgi:hypothetical protein
MKTTKLIVMSMALCVGATSAFGQVEKIGVLYGGGQCANATTISTTDIGVDSDGKVTCIIASNENAGLSAYAGANDCWLSDADNDVWFEFETSAGSDSSWWTISSDNGINDFDTDMQLALYEGSCATLTRVACSEDDGDCNTLAAGFTVKLADGAKYFLQADIFGADNLGKFALTIVKNAPVINDCIDGALPIDDAYTALGNSYAGSGWFPYNNYVYGNDSIEAADAPKWQEVLNVDNSGTGCQSAFSRTQNGGLRHDVWFEFTYDEDNPALLSVYSKNGCNAYVMELFTENTNYSEPSCNEDIDLLTPHGCSVQDGLPDHGDDEDWAKGDFTDHPRFNLQETTIKDGETVYVRVSQYLRVLVGDAAEAVAPPSEGYIKLVFEKESACLTSNGCGGDNECCKGKALNDGCQAPGANVHVQLSGLSNASMHGGIDAFAGGTALPDGRDHEAATYSVANGTTRADHNCSGTEIISGGKSLINNNNSILYRFTVEDAIQSVDISGIDTLLAVTINDSIVFVQNPLSPGDSIAIPSDEVSAVLALCSGITVSPGSNIPSGPLCPDSIVTVCGADVKFQFSNLNYCGVNGAGAEFFVVAVDTATTNAKCTNPTGIGNGNVVASFGELSTFQGSVCDTCLTMGPSAFYLPSGEYCLVIDGERGSLVDFNLDMWIDYNVPGTVIPCGTPCGAQTKSLTAPKANNFDNGVRPNYLAPHPAEGFTNFGFTTPVAGNVLYAITDINGRVVDSGNFAATEGENVHRFDVADLNTGLYVITLQINGVRTQVKLMKN